MSSSAALKTEAALTLDLEEGWRVLLLWKPGKEDVTAWQVRRSVSDLFFEGSLGGLVERQGQTLAMSAFHLPSSCWWICASLENAR